MRLSRVLLGLMMVAVTSGASSRAGQIGVPGPPTPDRPLDPSRSQPLDPNRVRLQEDQAKRANDERQKRLVADTTKLYELAGQLKDQVAKSDKNTLSVDVVKKSEEIERLARSIKEKMRG